MIKLPIHYVKKELNSYILLCETVL